MEKAKKSVAVGRSGTHNGGLLDSGELLIRSVNGPGTSRSGKTSES